VRVISIAEVRCTLRASIADCCGDAEEVLFLGLRGGLPLVALRGKTLLYIPQLEMFQVCNQSINDPFQRRAQLPCQLRT
jgi:hypothetical protein